MAFKTEKELCDKFISYVTELGFEVFPEFEDWDLVLRRNNVIVGVEAKLQRNMHLIKQIAEKNDVHIKVALFPFIRYHLSNSENDWFFIARKLKILPVYVDFDRIGIHWDVRGLFYYRNHPKHLLKLPEFKYQTDAGVPSPHKVNNNNINLVKVELFALENGGELTLEQIRSFGFKRAPWSFEFNWPTRKWRLRPFVYTFMNKYPHILKGLQENKNANNSI